MKVSHRITRLVAVASLPGRSLPPPRARGRPAGPAAPNTAEPVVIEPVVQSVDEGFDWTSAAIGAGAAGGSSYSSASAAPRSATTRAPRRRALAATPARRSRGRHDPPSAAAPGEPHSRRAVSSAISISAVRLA